jgi:hypothetical protein
MPISTDHDGYPIVYDEGANRWQCAALNLSADSLGALRALIDAGEARSAPLGIAAFLFDHSGFSVTPVTVVRLHPDGESAWIVNKLDDPRGERQEYVSLKRLVEDTAESRRLLLDWRDASRQVYEESLRVARLRDAIPRMSERTAGDEASLEAALPAVAAG